MAEDLVGRDAGYAILKLNSGETRMVPAVCMATVGAVSNPDNSNVSIGKAVEQIEVIDRASCAQ